MPFLAITTFLLSTLTIAAIIFSILKRFPLRIVLMPWAFFLVYLIGYIANLAIIGIAIAFDYREHPAFRNPGFNIDAFMQAAVWVLISFGLFAILCIIFAPLWQAEARSISNYRNFCVDKSQKLSNPAILSYVCFILMLIAVSTILVARTSVGIVGVVQDEPVYGAGVLYNVRYTVIPILLAIWLNVSIVVGDKWQIRASIALFIVYAISELYFRTTKASIFISLVFILVSFPINRSLYAKQVKRTGWWLRLSTILISTFLILILYPFLNVFRNIRINSLDSPQDIVNMADIFQLPVQSLDMSIGSQLLFGLISICGRITGANSLMDMIAVNVGGAIGSDFLFYKHEVLGNVFTELVYGLPIGGNHTTAPGMLGFFYISFGPIMMIVFVAAITSIFFMFAHMINRIKLFYVSSVLSLLLLLYWLPLGMDGRFDEEFILNVSGIRKFIGYCAMALLVRYITPKLFQRRSNRKELRPRRESR